MKNWKLGLSPFVLALTVLLLAGACKKYEEGPAFSLRSPESRLTQKWVVEKATEPNGDDATDDYNDYSIDFNDDNTFVVADKLGTQSYTVEGTWEFNDDKTSLISTFEFNFGGTTITEKDTVMILRLTNKEFWVKGDDGDEIQHVPAE